MENAFIQAYILLGSNLSNPLQQVTNAIAELRLITGSKVFKVSSFYLSKPVGPADQPDYINAVVGIETSLSAHQLLRELQAIEKQHGRERSTKRWGPRTLDLDLLLYGNKAINTPALIVPHPELVHRNFVLFPLYEITPELIMPNGQTLKDLCTNCSQEGLKKYQN